jgi:hypothetical protein
MSDFKSALEKTGITIYSFDPQKTRPIKTNLGTFTLEKFSAEMFSKLRKHWKDFPEVIDALNDKSDTLKLLEDFAANEISDGPSFEIPEELAHLTLNIDMASTDPGLKKFFCTNKNELIDVNTSGQYYMSKSGISPAEASMFARPVVPRYMPRRKLGIHTEKDKTTGMGVNYYNTHIPSAWELFKMNDPDGWDDLPSRPPEFIIRLIKHVIPSKEERNYFYAWLYTSIKKRSYVYLVLCGNPGVGKNRLKLLMRSLHGERNSADGKKETFGANQSKFNSQMEQNTFVWFDELKYGPDMEPRMKEYQNDYISIERKGQDSTRSTEIFCSMVISNNYPRDNYLLFNSRKFAPLVLGTKALTNAMTSDEIKDMSERLDDTHPRFDVKLVAQIAKWILDIGPKYVSKWPNLEYQGPMYWKLAHTSLSRWQKIAVLALTVENNRGKFKGWDEKKQAFLWSRVEEQLRVKKEYESKDYRDPNTVKAFFENYCDVTGNKVFEVQAEEDSVIQDFWIKPINGLIKKDITYSLNGDQADIIGKPMRPKGISDFKWRKMKAEYERTKGIKDGPEKETDLF